MFYNYDILCPNTIILYNIRRFTAGATDVTDAKASFSNYGTCIDIFAPVSYTVKPLG